jgi:hypothetical protein
MENLAVKNNQHLLSKSTEELQKRYDFVNSQIIANQFRRVLPQDLVDEYMNDWWEIQFILSSRRKSN